MANTNTASTADVKHIDTTIESLEKHVKDESTTGISTSINSWMKTLEKHEELKDIASDLGMLKEAIADKDSKKIVALMTKLGKDTTMAAEQAEGDEGKNYMKIGKALTKAAKAISHFTK